MLLPLQVEAEEHLNVVVYDQSTRDANALATDSFLSILLGKLDCCFHSVSILTGRTWQKNSEHLLRAWRRSIGGKIVMELSYFAIGSFL